MGNREENFDVRSVMDILYGENPNNYFKHKGFASAVNGKKAIREEEIIRNTSEEENALTRKKDYTSFWRNKEHK